MPINEIPVDYNREAAGEAKWSCVLSREAPTLAAQDCFFVGCTPIKCEAKQLGHWSGGIYSLSGWDSWGKTERSEKPAITRNQIQYTWLVQPALCH